MAKIKNSCKPNADEDTEKLDHSYIADRNVKWYSHSENILAVSLKTKHADFITGYFS